MRSHPPASVSCWLRPHRTTALYLRVPYRLRPLRGISDRLLSLAVSRMVTRSHSGSKRFGPSHCTWPARVLAMAICGRRTEWAQPARTSRQCPDEDGSPIQGPGLWVMCAGLRIEREHLRPITPIIPITLTRADGDVGASRIDLSPAVMLQSCIQSNCGVANKYG